MRDRLQGATQGAGQQNQEAETAPRAKPALPGRLRGRGGLAPLQRLFPQADIMPRIRVAPRSDKGARAPRSAPAGRELGSVSRAAPDPPLSPPAPRHLTAVGVGAVPEDNGAELPETRVKRRAMKPRGKPRAPQTSHKSARDARAAARGHRVAYYSKEPRGHRRAEVRKRRVVRAVPLGTLFRGARTILESQSGLG